MILWFIICMFFFVYAAFVEMYIYLIIGFYASLTCLVSRYVMKMSLRIPLVTLGLGKQCLQELLQKPINQKIMVKTTNGSCPSNQRCLQVKAYEAMFSYCV